MWYLKMPNNYNNNILMATSAPCKQARHSVCHVVGFHQWVDGMDYFKNDFHFLGTTLVTKSILGPNWELAQNVETKSVLKCQCGI